MSKELKDLIESIDSTNRAHSDLAQMIRYLREEVQRLTFTINEQKQIIQNQRLRLKVVEENDLPKDIDILKDMIANQRKEIIKKDKDIEILKQTLEDITNELDTVQNFNEESEELTYANKAIVQLTEENEFKSTKIKELEEKIKTIQIFANEDDVGDRYPELIDAKKVIFQLTEENGINRVKIESLKAELAESTTKYEDIIDIKTRLSEELKLLREEHENLIIENNEYEEKVNYLQKKIEGSIKNYLEEQRSDSWIKITELNDKLLTLESENQNLQNALKTNVDITDNLKHQNIELENKIKEIKNLDINREAEYRKNMAQKEEKLKDLNVKLEKIENANKQLNQLLIKLNEQEKRLSPIGGMKITRETSEVGFVSPFLFLKMFRLLSEQDKSRIEDILINNLIEIQREKRITAIKLLSIIKTPKVFEAFKKLIKDNDWIVKLYLIKALIKFDNFDVKPLLEELIKDIDIDVREAAEKVLKRFNIN